jgi:hypothetical protein
MVSTFLDCQTAVGVLLTLIKASDLVSDMLFAVALTEYPQVFDEDATSYLEEDEQVPYLALAIAMLFFTGAGVGFQLKKLRDILSQDALDADHETGVLHIWWETHKNLFFEEIPQFLITSYSVGSILAHECDTDPGQQDTINPDCSAEQKSYSDKLVTDGVVSLLFISGMVCLGVGRLLRLVWQECTR